MQDKREIQRSPCRFQTNLWAADMMVQMGTARKENVPIAATLDQSWYQPFPDDNGRRVACWVDLRAPKA